MIFLYILLFQFSNDIMIHISWDEPGLVFELFMFRTSHRRCSLRKGVLRNLEKFTGKNLCQSLFFYEVAGLRPVTLLKKKLWHRCYPVNFAKFLKTPFLQNTSGRLLLKINIRRSLLQNMQTIRNWVHDNAGSMLLSKVS